MPNRMHLKGLFSSLLAFALLASCARSVPPTTSKPVTQEPAVQAPSQAERTLTPKPLTFAPVLSDSRPDSLCKDGQMVVYAPKIFGPGTPPPAFGFNLVGDSQNPLPPYPGESVQVKSYAHAYGWQGQTVRIYATGDGFFQPHQGNDPMLRECLDQAAYFLGEGPVLGDHFDFPFTVPETVSIRNNSARFLDMPQGPVGYQLVGVTDEGWFGLGPVLPILERYVLKTTLTAGNRIVVEGSGLKPEGQTLKAFVLFSYRDERSSGSFGYQIGSVAIRGGRIELEWQIPEAVTKPGTNEPAPLVGPQEIHLAPDPVPSGSPQYSTYFAVPVSPATPAMGSPTPVPPATAPPRPTPSLCGPSIAELPCKPGVTIGAAYSFLLYTHCSVRSAYFNGQRWIATPILTRPDNMSVPPRGWNDPFDLGTMVLLHPNLARFTSRTGQAAEFRPLAPGEEYPWTRPCI